MATQLLLVGWSAWHCGDTTTTDQTHSSWPQGYTLLRLNPPWHMHRNPRICPDKRWPPELPERAAEWTQIHPASSSLAPMATPYSSCCLWVWEEVNTESTSPAAKLHVECIYLSVCHVSLFGQLFPQLWVLWAFAVILQIAGIFVLQVDPILGMCVRTLVSNYILKWPGIRMQFGCQVLSHRTLYCRVSEWPDDDDVEAEVVVNDTGGIKRQPRGR